MTDPAFSTLPAPAADTLWNDPTCSRRLRVVGIDDTHVTAEVGTTRVGEFVKVRTTRILRRTWAARMNPLAGVRQCRKCGCTDDRACPGGCWWVPDPDGGDLCSACPTGGTR